MITEDQTRVIEFLASASTHGGATVEHIETHASIVFLAGERAWKLKRAVRYDYLDFSTAERRKAMCEAEVRVNRRTAPQIYRGVVAVTRERDGSLALGGAGMPVDWLVEMTRFDQEGLFDRLAARDALDLRLMPTVAAAIAQFHRAAQSRFDHGGRSGMARVIDGNADSFAQDGAGILDPDSCSRVTIESRDALDRHAARLDSRREMGFVRECHGDLHLRNIVLLDGHPTLFDAIEFNDDIACIDVVYDVAFLLMDLWRLRLAQHANAVLNGYLAETEDFDGVPLLPLFLSCRAAVRAKTSVAAARLVTDPKRRAELHALSRDYLHVAAQLLHPPDASLVAVGGLSGSGKSSLSLALAPSLGAVPGALVLRSDETRKRLLGVPPLTRLDADGYRPEISRRVYATVAEHADAVVRGGHAVIVDSVFARPADRDAIEHVATTAKVPFVGLWLDAPEPVLFERVRLRSSDPSDADAGVIRMQLSQHTGPIRWHRIDASGTAEAVLERATTVLRSRVPNLVP